ncbi:MAG: ATP-binding protein [Desulfobacterales bacterium]|nr:ATP-binding protein [Desulfobacterales bacterium]MBF0397522.1 ATP-binding protein [Desulfobacterales bacterium]
MKELVIISGKGGTGKTTFTAALASMAENVVFCDADVDAADLHLILNPKIKLTNEFRAGHKAVINSNKCIKCGSCIEWCKWKAIGDTFRVDPILCEGCGVCYYLCPEKAVDFHENICGNWFISDTRFGSMVHAQLGIAEENSGKLVSLVRKEARKIAQEKGLSLILTDGPPGVGCPVIASIGGASAVIIITEPTISGKHDMERVIQLSKHFNVPAMVCINKFDLNLDMTGKILDFVKEQNLKFLGYIPFDIALTKSMINRQNIFEYDSNSKSALAIKEIWGNILKEI